MPGIFADQLASLSDIDESWLSVILFWHCGPVPEGKSLKQKVADEVWPEVNKLYSVAVETGFLAKEGEGYFTTEEGVEWFQCMHGSKAA